MYTITRLSNVNTISVKSEMKINATYKYFDSEEKNILTSNSYSKFEVFDISSSKVLDFYKKQIILSSMKAFPHYQIFLKSRSTIIHQNRDKLYNTVGFKLQIDDEKQIVWITPSLSLDDRLRVQNDLAKLEKDLPELENVDEDEEFDI